MVNCMRNIDPERKKLYIGIDLDDNRAMVSFLGPGEKEPVSASVQKPEETGCFPTSLYIGKSDRYLYGAEAEKKCGSLEGEFYDHLFLGQEIRWIQRLLRRQQSIWRFTCAD